MDEAIRRVMSAYGLLNKLTLAEERQAREDLTRFLLRSKIADENKLAVEGIKFLRDKQPKRRTA